jgi:hypothetical protein
MTTSRASMPNNLEGVRQELLTALPDSVDRERLLAAVTRILGRPLLAPAKLVAHYEDQADGIRRFAANQRSLPSLDFVDRHGLLQQLAVQEQYCRRHAEAYKGLSIKHPPVFARQVELLFEFELCGGDVADYKRGRKREDDPHWPDPKGTVISYLRSHQSWKGPHAPG